MADVNQILRTYGKRLSKNVRLKYLAEHAYGYKDAEEFADKAGSLLCDVLKMYMDPSTVTQEEAVRIFSAVMRKNYSDVVDVCNRVQRRMYADIGVGLGPLTPEFNADRVKRLATAITDAETVSDEYVKNLVVNGSRSVVDDAIRVNAAASDSMGMAVHITRKYDDVGLHNGKDQCEWCLERCGEWDDYQEAYDAGCFERHPGCGCVIEYHVGKTHTWQNAAGGWNVY